MNTKTALKGTSAHGGPVILGAGIAMLTFAVLTTGHDAPSAAAARPAPTVTVTTTPAPAGVRRPPHPSPSTSAGSGATVVAAGNPAYAETRPGGSPDGPVDTQTVRPSPTSQPSASSCGGRLVSVRLPLGALPHCALTVGGSR